MFFLTDFVQVYTGGKQDCCVTDLQPGTDYTFRVQATNEAGVSHNLMIITILLQKTLIFIWIKIFMFIPGKIAWFFRLQLAVDYTLFFKSINSNSCKGIFFHSLKVDFSFLLGFNFFWLTWLWFYIFLAYNRQVNGRHLPPLLPPQVHQMRLMLLWFASKRPHTFVLIGL